MFRDRVCRMENQEPGKSRRRLVKETAEDTPSELTKRRDITNRIHTDVARGTFDDLAAKIRSMTPSDKQSTASEVLLRKSRDER